MILVFTASNQKTKLELPHAENVDAAKDAVAVVVYNEPPSDMAEHRQRELSLRHL